MARTIKHHRDVLAKARSHKVRKFYADRYQIVSGTSGRTYYPILNPDGHSCKCDCLWGRQGGWKVLDESACSHVLALFIHREEEKGRTIQTWAELADALRQHRPIVNVGNGVLLTSRLAA